MAITINKLISGAFNIITNGGGSEPAGHEKTLIWFKGQDDYEEFDWSGEINQQTMIDAGMCANLAWTRNPVKVEIGTKVTSIGKTAFINCYDSLTTISIPNSVTSIGNSAFSFCGSLTTISIPNSVTSIGKTAFYECVSLTSITIPSSVSSIGENAFKKCNSLTSMSILGFTQAQIRANASSWGLNTGISITASDGTFTL